jgi:hypothetical protein
MWFSYNARYNKLSDTAIYVRLRFCALDSVGLIQPVWFLVRYNNVQRNDVTVRLSDTYECVLDEALTEYMLLMLILLIVNWGYAKRCQEPNQDYELLGQSDVCWCTCHSSLSVAVDTPGLSDLM